jgi:hypothetical protein
MLGPRRARSNRKRSFSCEFFPAQPRASQSPNAAFAVTTQSAESFGWTAITMTASVASITSATCTITSLASAPWMKAPAACSITSKKKA